MEKNLTEEERLAQFSESLLDWYREHKRSFPWRDKNNAYYTWISEIMLQQTRAQAVIPYFERFIKALPDIKALASCRDDDLLKLWEGLGYYSRAGNLKKTAVIVTEKYGGSLPDTFEELLRLPGIGRYTAGAISSIAYGQPFPAVDGNVMRVVSRVLLNREDILNSRIKQHFEELLKKVMPEERPGDLNQAMMDLGAMICLPAREPDCPDCPVRDVCLTRETGLWKEIPARSAKKERRIENRTVFIIQDGSRTAIRKRNKKGLFAGMYEFPNESGEFTREEALSYVEKNDLVPLYIEAGPESKHIFTHIEWHMKAYRIRVSADHADTGTLFFVDFSEQQDRYAVPSAFDTYKKYLSCHT